MTREIRKRFGIVLLLALASVNLVAGPSGADGVRSRLYKHRFETAYPVDKVMEVFYEAKHYKKFVPDVKKVTVLEKRTQSYVVKYEYSYLLGHAEATYIKSIFPDEGLVTFELVQYKSDSSFLPKIVESIGYYRVEPGLNGKNKVTYQQKFQFDRSLNWMFRKIFDSKNKRFSRGFANYIQGLAGK